jgi:HD-GYP domain-containing protein (c-di-GMP phosphodiesterase class II)
MGMYVVELDCPWNDTPFEMPFHLQGFKIRTLEELQKVKEISRHVIIDIRLGRDTKFGTFIEKQESGGLKNSLPGISPTNQLDSVYDDTTTVEEEIVTARQIMGDAKNLYARVLSQVREGKEVDIGSLRDVVSSMTESVIRNPHALMWLIQLKSRDTYTYAHSIAACVLALAFGRYLGLPEPQLKILGLSTLLQDIGKLKLPMDLLHKSAPLTREEHNQVMSHVTHSVDILRKHPQLPMGTIEIVSAHHERYDGSGYPRGLKGDNINLVGTMNATTVAAIREASRGTISTWSAPSPA